MKLSMEGWRSQAWTITAPASAPSALLAARDMDGQQRALAVDGHVARAALDPSCPRGSRVPRPRRRFEIPPIRWTGRAQGLQKEPPVCPKPIRPTTPLFARARLRFPRFGGQAGRRAYRKNCLYAQNPSDLRRRFSPERRRSSPEQRTPSQASGRRVGDVRERLAHLA